MAAGRDSRGKSGFPFAAVRRLSPLRVLRRCLWAPRRAGNDTITVSGRVTLSGRPAMGSISHHEIRQELERILQSRHFAKAPKKRRFLEFVCLETVGGRGGQLNEHLIGMEVYERGPDFDPHEDSIVRVQAHELRKSLARYYEREGKDDPIRIDLPPGNYVPVFTRRPEGEPLPPAPAVETTAPVHPGRRWERAALLLLLASTVVLGLALVQAHRQRPSTPAWPVSYTPAMEWFWGRFLPPAPPPLIVLPVHPILRAAHEGDSDRTRNSGYVIPKDELAEFRDTVHYRELKQFAFVPSTTDFTAIGETLGLVRLFQLFSSAGQTFRVKAARLVDFEEVKASNAILLGGNQAWSGRIFLYKEGFWFHEGLIKNMRPQPGELSVYRPVFDPVTNQLRRDYALVLMLPNENRERRILLSYGIYTQGSQAAIEFMTNPDRLEELRRALLAASPDGKTLPDYFQALIETAVENAVPGPSSLVAVRLVPEEGPAVAGLVREE